MPWDYPFLNDSMAICDAFGRLCFKRYMEDGKIVQKCDFCQNDCNAIDYQYSIYSTKIDGHAICSNKKQMYALNFGTKQSKYYRMPPN